MLLALLLGTAIGFISAIPVAGPVSAVIFKYGMRGKSTQGRMVALGAGLGEAAYCALAFWGFTQIFLRYERILQVSQLIAGAVLGALGIYFFVSRKMRHMTEPQPGGPRRTKRSFLMGLGMAAANPSLVATWTAAITTVHSFHVFEFGTWSAVAFAGGVWLGIYAWFALFLRLLARFRGHINEAWIDRLLKGIGLLLATLAIVMVYRTLANG